MAGQLIFQLPTFHWPSEDQQTAFEEWQSHITLTVGSIQYPPREMVCQHCWFPGQQKLQAMAASRDLQRHRRKKNTRKHVFTAFANTLEVSMSQWNYIDEMYSDIRAGRTRNHWPVWSMHQDLGWEMRLCISRREDEMLTGATLSCNETLRS